MKNTDFPQYSTLMSVYFKESPDNLKAAVESMFSQTVPPSEFVLVIDGKVGPDLQNEISQLAERFSIKEVYLPENLGLGPALNVGLRACSFEIVARMDSDDIALPERMEKQLRLMQDSSADIVSSPVLEFEGNRDNITATKNLPQTHSEIMSYLRRRNPFNHPAVTYKRDVIKSLGGYKDFKLFEDYELFARALTLGAVGANTKDPTLLMRAGDAMYDRRGGRQYIKKMLKFYKSMQSLGLCSFKEKITCVLPRCAVSMLPTKVRRFVYKKLLRS